ncbi:hypothetical protein [Psychromonas aquimarina]|uniref:hypothetical protein n=1 Tax=Psychromonas aquimarina TaxID=444919 RepID=UPI000490D8ED|nr:hypothetical protein [Psychromonas aquimarina]
MGCKSVFLSRFNCPAPYLKSTLVKCGPIKHLYIFLLLAIVGCSINSGEYERDRLQDKLSPLKFIPTHFIKGDFNGDGLLDEATIVQYRGEFHVPNSVNEKQYWAKSQNNNEIEEALIVVLDIANEDSTVYALRSDFSRFSTPSFSLLSIPPSDNSVAELVADGHVIVVPSEAGIDEFIFVKNNELSFYSPEEIQ